MEQSKGERDYVSFKIYGQPLHRRIPVRHDIAEIGNTGFAYSDGGNEHGFAAGLTFVYPVRIAPGLNAGMLLRYLLEKCQIVKEVLESLRQLPIASAQTFTLADHL